MNLLEKLKAAFEQIKTFLRSLLDKCLALFGKLKSVVIENWSIALAVVAVLVVLALSVLLS
jgi:hypothetical protein